VCYNGGKCVPGNPDAWRCECPGTWTDPMCKTAKLTCNTTGLVCEWRSLPAWRAAPGAALR
jgi:hypothetical protein